MGLAGHECIGTLLCVCFVDLCTESKCDDILHWGLHRGHRLPALLWGICTFLRRQTAIPGSWWDPEGALWLSQNTPNPQSEYTTQHASRELDVTPTPREAASPPTETDQASPIPDREQRMVLTLSYLEGGKEPPDRGLGT